MSDFLDSTDYHPRNIRYKRVKKKRALDTLVRVRGDSAIMLAGELNLTSEYSSFPDIHLLKDSPYFPTPHFKQSLPDDYQIVEFADIGNRVAAECGNPVNRIIVWVNELPHICIQHIRLRHI